MSPEEKTYHLIDQYLRGELKGTALDRFKAQLKNDEQLQFEVATQDQIIKSVEQARHQELKEYIKANTGAKTIQMNRKAAIWTLSSAAAIALLVGAFFVIQNIADKQDPGTVASDNKDQTEEGYVDNDQGLMDSGSSSIDTQILANNEPPVDFDPTLPPPPPPALEIEDDAIENASNEIPEVVEVQEVVDDNEVEEESEDRYAPTRASEVKKVPAAKQTETPVKQDKIVKEEMLSNTYVVVQNINANFDSYTSKDLDEVATTSGNSRSGKDKSYKSKEDAEVDMVESGSPENSATGKAPNSTRNIELQYWKSPVNYTGYNYNGSQVKLYGVPTRKKLEFKELDTRLYVKIGRKQYYLENNTKYNRLVEVTNPALLKVLNE